MNFFVYGTLRDADRARAVLDDAEYGPDVTLDGMHPVEGAYPTLAPGGSTDGRILRTSDVAALDDYEGVDAGLYVRVTVPRADADDAAQVYVGDPDRLEVSEPVEWPGDGALSDRVMAYVRGEGVVVRLRD